MKLKYPQNRRFQKSMEEFVFSSDAMRDVMRTVHQVAKYDVNVMITGESGTGKEMLAKIIHLQSHRAKNPFVPVNCGVLSGLMFADKLFGHEKGAFTGAIDQKKGCFELAHKGTLFLDEISELNLDSQVDFLRILQDFSFLRIGGDETITVDVRIISASNRDLKDAISNNNFREDLFYRLQVVPIHLPPLRERKQVIPKMVDHFLNQFEMKHKKNKPAIHEQVQSMFLEYRWPGNVRELKNLVEHIFILNESDTITLDALPHEFLKQFQSSDKTQTLAEIRQSAEMQAIRETISQTGGNKEKAAKLLDISPRTLRHKLQQYQITIPPSLAP